MNPERLCWNGRELKIKSAEDLTIANGIYAMASAEGLRRAEGCTGEISERKYFSGFSSAHLKGRQKSLIIKKRRKKRSTL